MARPEWDEDTGDESVDEALNAVQRRLERDADEDEEPDSDADLHDLPEKEHHYFYVTRSLSASFIFALPLLAVYELGIAAFGKDINLLAVLVKTPIAWLKDHPSKLLGTHPLLILNGILIVAAIVALWRLGRKKALHPGTFGGMLVESVMYALLLGPLALLMLTGKLHIAGFSPNFDKFTLKVVASCGAGLYEELVFRAVLLGSIYVLAKEAAGLRPFTAGFAGLVLSGAVFSAAHFLSPGEAVDLGAFLYRLFAGIFLGVIFLTRGFGIAAWTHALYDVYVLCLTQS